MRRGEADTTDPGASVSTRLRTRAAAAADCVEIKTRTRGVGCAIHSRSARSNLSVASRCGHGRPIAAADNTSAAAMTRARFICGGLKGNQRADQLALTHVLRTERFTAPSCCQFLVRFAQCAPLQNSV